MQIFNSNDTTTFYLNSKKYVKNYVVIPVGNTHIAIYNAYDTKLQILPSTHYSQISIDGTTYGSQIALMNVLSPLIFYKNTSGGGGSINQNNVAIFNEYFLGGEGDVTAEDACNLLNLLSSPIIVNETQTPVIFSFARVNEGITKKYLYLFIRGKGIFGGSIGTPIETIDIRLLSVLTVTPDDIEGDENNQITDLGEIPDGDFVTVANSSEEVFDFSDNSKSYYFTYTMDDVLYFVLFVGENAVYAGDSDNSFVEEDFVSITNDTAQPTPALQEVTDVGNQTTNPIVIYGGGYKVIRSNAGEDYTDSNGRTIKVQYPSDGLTEDVITYSVPAKTVDDTYAMHSDINGMTITANQAASELYLNNAEGTTIATLNVGFLNNEGTTFFYNATTEMLELKDDEGNVLSSVPVSAFVSNLMQSVNFNGSTPYVLEFKDAEGNIVDSVSFAISNIQGLQSALDNKISTSHPANTVTTSGITNWDTAYSWGNHATAGYVTTANTDQTADGVKTWSKDQRFMKSIVNMFDGSTGTGDHLRKLNNWITYVSGTASVTGSAQIKFPVIGNMMWQMTVQIIEYQAATGTKPPIELTITGYQDVNSHATVSTSNPSDITQVRFGRNVANDKTFIIIDKSSNWTYPKVIVKEFIFHHQSNDSLVLNRANYSVSVSSNESDYVSGTTITAASFARDQHFLNANNLNAGTIAYARLPFTSTDVANWNASVPTSYANAKSSVSYGSGGESLNSLPKGTYTATISTLATDKPFTSTGALISVGDLSNGYQILGSRTGTEFWFRPYSTTYGTWIKMYSSIDVSGLYMPLGTNIPTSSNLDSYQSTGHFNCISNAIASSGTNFPSPVAGTLTVNQSANALVYQRYHTAGGSENNVYVRVLAGGVWTGWNKLWGSKDFTSTNVTNWNTAYGWGSHSGLYLQLSGGTVQNNNNNVLTVLQNDNSLSNNTYTFKIDSSAHSSNATAAGAMAVDVNSGRAFTVNGFGNVLIGASAFTTGYKFDVSGDTRLSGTLRVGNVSNATGDTLTIDSNGDIKRRTASQIINDGGISSTNISNWNTAFTNSHTHANKALLDTYTQTETDLADAVAKKHTHANIDVLSGITSGNVTNWNTAYGWGDYRVTGWGSGLETNPIYSGNVVSITSAGIYRVNASGSTGLPSGAVDGVFMSLNIGNSLGARTAMYFDDNNKIWFGNRAGMSIGWRRVAESGEVNTNTTDPDKAYLNGNYGFFNEGARIRFPFLTTPAEFVKLSDGNTGDWMRINSTIVT